MIDYYLLMMVIFYKGDFKNFCLFLELLDKDVYGDVRSLEEVMVNNVVFFYLCWIKEVFVIFFDFEIKEVKKFFFNCKVEIIEF